MNVCPFAILRPATLRLRAMNAYRRYVARFPDKTLRNARTIEDSDCLAAVCVYAIKDDLCDSLIEGASNGPTELPSHRGATHQK